MPVFLEIISCFMIISLHFYYFSKVKKYNGLLTLINKVGLNTRIQYTIIDVNEFIFDHKKCLYVIRIVSRNCSLNVYFEMKGATV